MSPVNEWIDLDCGCKTQTPVAPGCWTVTTGTQLSLDLGDSEEEEWEFWMSCPCGDNQLHFNKTRFVWSWMDVGEEE